MVDHKMTPEEAIEWVKAHTHKDVFVRRELESAYNALVCGAEAAISDADLWNEDDLWLFCEAEVHPPTSFGIMPPIGIADIRDVLVRLARSGILNDSSHACLRAASLLMRVRSAIFFRQYDPRLPVSDAEAAAAYKKIREVILRSE